MAPSHARLLARLENDTMGILLDPDADLEELDGPIQDTLDLKGIRQDSDVRERIIGLWAAGYVRRLCRICADPEVESYLRDMSGCMTGIAEKREGIDKNLDGLYEGFRNLSASQRHLIGDESLYLGDGPIASDDIFHCVTIDQRLQDHRDAQGLPPVEEPRIEVASLCLMNEFLSPPAVTRRVREKIRRYRTSSVVQLAEAIGQSNKFDTLFGLHDALMEAGCTENVVLDHLRLQFHARGCWLIDEILEKR